MRAGRGMELRGNFVHQLQVSPRSFRVPKVFSGRSRVFCTIRVSPFRDVLTASSNRWKRIEALNSDGSQSLQQSSIPSGDISKLQELSFDRLQVSDLECQKGPKRVFGRYVARGAVLDEEYWTAAWLRAESHWENVPDARHVDVYKRNFAEQEFNSLKERCAERRGNTVRCHCIVAAKKEEKNVRRTLLNSIVGTLDICVQSFLQGETFPGGLRRATTFATVGARCLGRYAYVANLCVAKYARRQGIGTNMMYLATDFAMLAGIKKIFIHVNADNMPAQELYQKIGYEVKLGTNPIPIFVCFQLVLVRMFHHIMTCFDHLKLVDNFFLSSNLGRWTKDPVLTVQLYLVVLKHADFSLNVCWTIEISNIRQHENCKVMHRGMRHGGNVSFLRISFCVVK